jgi:hypothetical protein
MLKISHSAPPLPRSHETQPATLASLRNKLTSMGVKQIIAPRTLPKACREINEQPATKALVAVLDTERGEHLTELYDNYTLLCAKRGVYAASYYLLSIPQITELAEFHAAMMKGRCDAA